MKTLCILILNLVVAPYCLAQVNFKINTAFSSGTELNTSRIDRVKKELSDLNKTKDSMATRSGQPAEPEAQRELAEKIAEKQRELSKLDEDPYFEAMKKHFQTRLDEIDKQLGELNDEFETASENQLPDLKQKRNALLAQKKDVEMSRKDLVDVYNFRKKSFRTFFKTSHTNAYFNIMYSENSNRLNAINNSGFSIGDQSGSVYSELASGNMKLVRLSLGIMTASSSIEEEEQESNEEAFQRLATQGGNTVFTMEYPLFYWCDKENQYNFIGRLLGKAAGDFKAFGTQTDDFAGNLTAAADVYLDFSTSKREIRVYGNFYASYNWANENFKTNLSLEKKDFSFGKVTLGLVVKEKFNLSFIVNTFSSESGLSNHNVILGGSLIL